MGTELFPFSFNLIFNYNIFVLVYIRMETFHPLFCLQAHLDIFVHINSEITYDNNILRYILTARRKVFEKFIFIRFLTTV